MSLFTTLPILSDEDFFDMCVNPIEIIIPHTNILQEIKKDILNDLHKIKVQKKTIF